ncbi:MAG: ribonucleoside-diphosphate reductase subunit alpha [Thermaceae bacterium]
MTGLFEGIRKDLVETLHREAGLAPGEDPSLSHSVEEALLLATLQNLHLEPELETLARRLKLREIYRKVLGVADPDGETYQGGFIRYVERAAAEGLLDGRALGRADLKKLGEALRPERDLLLPYTGFVMLLDRYALRRVEADGEEVLEVPQYFWMRVALGLALREEDPTPWAIRFYEAMSTLRIIPSTPTLYNALTPRSQLASCYTADVEDSMESILSSAQEFGLLAKYAGGIGVSLTKLRALGSPIRGVGGRSSGLVPFAHLYDALIAAVNQGGRRRGTIALYIEPWHLEVEEFLDLRKNDGDPYRRTRRADTALFVPDLFMERVEQDGDWTLFDPLYAPGLTETFGPTFKTLYEEYEEKARRREIPEGRFKVLRARRLYREILAVLQETGHPWIVFKDAMNIRSLLPGMIHSSNLCTEIALPTSSEEVAVCNLASVNLARHLSGGGLDLEALRRTVTLGIRMLDNVIDLNFYPIERARRSNLKNRPIGLGVMGLAEVFARLGLPYGSPKSLELTDTLFEEIAHAALLASTSLAEERGAFPAFPQSRWADGVLPMDTLEELEKARGRPLPYPKGGRLSWEEARERAKKGVRNGTLMAVAPTASISLIAGTTPSLDPYYAALFTRQNLSGKFLEVNRALYEALKERGLWERVRERLVEERGDLTGIEEVPEELKSLFPTAYRIPPQAYLEVAARAGKWVDQAISRNLFLERRDLSHAEEVYLEAYQLGLKSTYYLFMAPRMWAEQATVKVNKAKSRPRWVLQIETQELKGDGSEVCESCQ